MLVQPLDGSFLFIGQQNRKKIDRFFKVCISSAIYLSERQKSADFRRRIMKIPTLSDTMIILGVVWSHWIGTYIADILCSIIF